MKSCRFLLDDGLQGAASCLSVALGCSVTVVDSPARMGASAQAHGPGRQSGLVL